MIKVICIKTPKKVTDVAINIGDICNAWIYPIGSNRNYWAISGKDGNRQGYFTYPKDCFTSIADFRNQRIDEILED